MSKKKSPTKKSKKKESPPLENPADLKSKQARLPQMDDPVIEEIEAAAEKYVDIRDQRMALTDQEVDRKGLLLTLMKRHDKTHYKRNGVEVSVVVEKEKVKVKVSKDE